MIVEPGIADLLLLLAAAASSDYRLPGCTSMYFVVDANGFQVYYWSAFTAESEIQGEKVVAECATLELRLSGVGYDLSMVW